MSSTHKEGTPHKAGAFDIRNFIGSLLGIYGLILVLTAILDTDDAALAKSDGVHINLYTGIGLLVACAVFLGWARLRPVVVPPSTDADDDDGPEAERAT